MSKIKNLLSRLKKIPRTRYIALLAVIVLAVAIAIPTLSRYKNRIDIEALLSDENNWDGTVATSYRNGSGTSKDPYIISNAKELAYFAQMLNETNYENTYFELSNDIIINNGTFAYTTENITYTLNKTTLYLEEYTTNIYSSSDLSGDKISSINQFNQLNNFKGYFNGNYYSIYGLYITSNTDTELALFDNLKGTVENLYLENTLIYGGSTTASLATSASNATIKDIFIDGDVVGTTDKKSEVETQSIDDLTYTKTESKLTESITLPTTTKTPTSVKLTGTYTSTSEKQTITINDQEVSAGDFTIDLGTTLLEEIELVVDDETESTITLTNLNYLVTYQTDTYAVSAGVVAKASSSTMTNIINKANVYGTNDSAGIVGTLSNTDLTNAYNTGSITATNYASGLISSIESSISTTNISKTYNAGELSAIATSSFVNNISNNAEVTIENSFNTQEAYYGINIIENTTVNISNVLDVNTIAVSVGETVGDITTDVTEEINDHTYLQETLQFNEYVDAKDLQENSNNAWVYEEGYLPILYFDDLNNPIATLYVGTYSWNDLGYELRDLYIKNEVGFRITSNDELNEYKEAYYYIHKGTGLTTREEVGQITDWTLYEDMVKLTEEGYYTIYVKVIDKNDNVTYINSEHLVLDLNEPDVTLTMNDSTWTTLKETLTKINILEKVTLTVEATGGYADVTTTKYYIANKVLTEDELDELESSKWTDYEDSIEITECGNYVVYIRVTDAADRVKYINSDNLIFGGYTETISVGKNTKVDTSTVNITAKSSITYNFKYEESRTYQEGDTNNLVTNILLPVNTIMTLYDNSTNEVYKYKITSSEDLYGYEESCSDDTCEHIATYPLNAFVKVGQTDTTKVFSDSDYTSRTTKDLSLTIDFSTTTISENTTLEAYLELKNGTEAVVSTLKDSIKTVNIYPNKDMSLVLNKLNTPATINYNSDSETEINLETYVSSKTIDNIAIYDTTTENKKLGIAIKLLDKDNNIVEKKHLKNIQFKVGDNLYSPDNDGIVRINLSDNLDKVSTTLKIITYLSNTQLDLGDYNFVITPFVAADGTYSSDLSATSINLPVSVTNKKVTGYGFKALITVLDEDNNETEFTSVISKTKEEADEVIAIPTTTLKVNILDTTTLQDKVIKVSLYKRATTLATDQTYELVDLQEYTNTELTSAGDKVYKVSNNSLTLELDNSAFTNNGYELRFELFDGDRKITTIKKKFITK